MRTPKTFPCGVRANHSVTVASAPGVIIASAGDPGVLQDELHRADVVVDTVLEAADLVTLVGVDLVLAHPAKGAEAFGDLADLPRRASRVELAAEQQQRRLHSVQAVSYTHLRAHETRH